MRGIPLRADIDLVDIHRENRRDAIHHRSQGAYNRSGQRGEGYAFHADGQQIAQQPRISLIRLAQGSIQGKRRDARNNHQQRDKQFDDARERHSPLRLLYILGG